MSSNPPGVRLQHIDILRGLVMVLMLLDHTRSLYSHFGSGQMLDPAHTHLALFLTRWLTHLCAPTFVFLAGTSAFLYLQRHTPRETASFLFTRGLWLIFLEWTVIKFAWAPEPFYMFSMLQVIWILGISMLVLSVLVLLPRPIMLCFGLVMVFGHNTLDGLQAAHFGDLRWFWMLLHQKGTLSPLPGHTLFIAYPILPWPGVMALGAVFGQWMLKERADRRRLTLRFGLLCLAAFVLLRGLSFYGEPNAWTSYPTLLQTSMSLLNCTKYPPSLLFLLMTLGLSTCLLAWWDREETGPVGRWLATIGSVPLFFYIVHLYLLRFSGATIAYIMMGARAFQPPPGPAGSPQLGLLWVYLVFFLALCLLTPLSSWYAKHKKNRTYGWLRFL